MINVCFWINVCIIKETRTEAATNVRVKAEEPRYAIKNVFVSVHKEEWYMR